MSRQTVGMYGGKFAPLHMGHVYSAIRASTMVDELHIIVSYDPYYEEEFLFKGTGMEPIPYYVRLRWWTQIMKDLPHVHVHAVYEEQTGNPYDWERGSEGIKKAIGKEIDKVFSSESHYSKFFDWLYPNAEHVVIDEDRETYTVSATEIRKEGAMKHWNMLPDIVKPYFAKKVVIVGTESCGKSTLVRNLANLYNTTYVEEWGRTFYEQLGGCEGITLKEDYPTIAFEHKYHEKEQIKQANKVMFVDTEAIVTQYYSLLYLQESQNVLDEVAKLQDYDMWLFLEPDVDWVDDGTRTFGEQGIREGNSEFLKDLLEEFDVDYITIKGNYKKRLETAVHHVNELVEMKGL